jgi:spore germination protein YaaH
MSKSSKNFSIAFSFVVIILTLFGISQTSFAATTQAKPFEVTGWIPYWSITAGTTVANKNLTTLTSIFPFGYGVNTDGTLTDLAKLATSPTWASLKINAKAKQVKFIPTITWTDGTAINQILSDKTLRTKHIDTIVSMVENGKFDGVDIDYEKKLAITKDNFSAFLTELKTKLGSKTLVCSIEARTPLSSLYRVIPTNIQYANDYKAIGKACDRVAILAYDQGRADFVLNNAKAGAPYNPIADAEWVRKVAMLASESIPKEKILLGVPTYGFNYEVTIAPNWFKGYKKVSSATASYATKTATLFGITPTRNKSGEMSYSFASGSTPKEIATYKLPSTLTTDTFANRALAYANATGKTFTFNTVWWSDADAIKQKVTLAKELGLAGISLFKIDGNEDPNIWTMLAK